MGNPSYGLRFDIYERVRLPEELVGISVLEEIEMTPHIQVIPQDDRAVLKGHLLLSGSYVGADEQRSGQTLEHFIPVEITLPMNRVHHIDEIAVSIDQFDVELLSERHLNVTGVLSLHGIAATPVAEEEPDWEEEEITVVHQTERPDGGQGSGYAPEGEDEAGSAESFVRSDADDPAARQYGAHANGGADVQAAGGEYLGSKFAGGESAGGEYVSGSAGGESAVDESIGGEFAGGESAGGLGVRLTRSNPADDAKNGVKVQKAANGSSDSGGANPSGEGDAEDVRQERWAVEAATDDQDRAAGAELAGDGAVPGEDGWRETAAPNPPEFTESAAEADKDQFGAADQVVPDAGGAEHPAADEEVGGISAHKDGELKVAFGKRPEEQSEGRKKLHVASLFRTKAAQEEAARSIETAEAQQKAEEAAEGSARSASTGDELDWKTLFLSTAGEERQFRKVRICIVQKEETLEMIAERYQLNPREIVLYNRLDDQNLSEGQVIYIPK